MSVSSSRRQIAQMDSLRSIHHIKNASQDKLGFAVDSGVVDMLQINKDISMQQRSPRQGNATVKRQME